jgi:hypothetical protein
MGHDSRIDSAVLLHGTPQLGMGVGFFVNTVDTLVSIITELL